MPFPTGATTITVTINRPIPAGGSGNSGRIVFTPSAVLVDATHKAIYSGSGSAILDANGAASIQLLTTDASGVLPAGWRWQVDEQLPGARRTYYVDLPSTLGATVDLSQLSPVSAPDGSGQSLPPTGPAGGALTGSYPNPQLSAHAASHGSGGSDPVTLTQAQVTGLVQALAALLPLAGGTITGSLTVQGYTTLQGGQFNSDFAAFGNMTLIGTGKSVRFRRDGDGVDVEGGGRATVVSVWSGADFTGTQHTYLRLEADQQLAQATGKWIFCDSPFSAGHTLTGTTLGFYGAAPVGKPTVTGSRGGNAALASLLTGLANIGLITDSTTA